MGSVCQLVLSLQLLCSCLLAHVEVPVLLKRCCIFAFYDLRPASDFPTGI